MKLLPAMTAIQIDRWENKEKYLCINVLPSVHILKIKQHGPLSKIPESLSDYLWTNSSLRLHAKNNRQWRQVCLLFWAKSLSFILSKTERSFM